MLQGAAELLLLSDRAQAQAELLEVIETSIRQHAFTPLLLALPPIAPILAEQGYKQRAVELHALAWHYPLLANSQGFNGSYGQRLDAVAPHYHLLTPMQPKRVASWVDGKRSCGIGNNSSACPSITWMAA